MKNSLLQHQTNAAFPLHNDLLYITYIYHAFDVNLILRLLNSFTTPPHTDQSKNILQINSFTPTQAFETRRDPAILKMQLMLRNNIRKYQANLGFPTSHRHS